MDDRRRTEPLSIVAGDSVQFTRALGRYLASDGWSLIYEGVGPGSKIEWISTVSQDGRSHDIDIVPATTIGYANGSYELSGYALNATTGERQQFYYQNLEVTLNLQTAQGDEDTRTHAQKMIEQLQALQLKMTSHDLNDSSTEGVEFRRKRLQEIREELDIQTRVRENELQLEAALNGRPSRKKIKMRLMVTNPAGVNQFGAGNNVQNLYP